MSAMIFSLKKFKTIHSGHLLIVDTFFMNGRCLLWRCLTVLTSLSPAQITQIKEKSFSIKLGFMVKTHANKIWMTYEYTRVTYEWHTSTYQWHTDDIRVHRSDIHVTYGWYTDTYEWHMDDIRVHTSNIRMTYEYIPVT